MRAETTDPDIGRAVTSFPIDYAEMQKKIAAAFERRGKRAPQIYSYEPAWEDPELHGAGREVQLRGRGFEGGATDKRQRAPLRLPPMPSQRLAVEETALIAGAVVGAGALAWWLWKRRQSPRAEIGALPDWAMT